VCAALDAVPGAADGGGPPGARAGTAGPTPAPALRILLSLEAMVDSAFLWALVLGRLRAGTAMAAALAETIAAVEAAGGTGRFNFLLTDGHSVAATACGDTLWYRLTDTAGPGPSAVVASEPSDDEPGWAEVPDRHVLTATPSAVELRPLAVPAHDRARTTVTPTTVTPRSLTQRP
ncbi:MAG TPA: hypothetical protein VHF26_25415, partial [Trebonia sp.]|nr:hypothetical protein [Trebonia sp.]